jgi:hypothetical protein
MPNDRNNLRGLLAALAIIGAATLVYSLLFATPAHAQLAVSDAPTETNTGKIASDLSTTNSTLGNILTQDTSAARSVTTGGAAGAWQSNSRYLNSLASNLNNGISSVSLFNSNFPGWLALPPNSTQLSKQVSAISLKTFAGALAAAQQQANGFAAEDSHLSGIEQSNQSMSTVLQGQQLIVEAILALCQQIQLERQLLVTQITLEATKAGEELNERAQQQATLAQSNNSGATP